MTDPNARIAVELLPVALANDERLVAHLRRIVNAAYAETESSLWAEGRERIDLERMATSIALGEVAIAHVGDDVVGCIRVQMLDAATSGFGLLAADDRHRGAGVGRELVAFAERHARERGATTMELELLIPLDGTHPFKARLNDWYTRLGYREVARRTVEEVEPGAERQLAQPCAFAIYRKPLAADV